MTCNEITCIAKANAKLPDNAYFAYLSKEIIEFHLGKEAQVELTDGRRFDIKAISKYDLSLNFDQIHDAEVKKHECSSASNL
ncbi:hypothetical protein E5672_15955 [Alteromonas portus]|uniref:Uncharacterized protein n=1 Tax=Alteromonas portus TaxID=2565549 RepID=A0A4U0Z801_9ALTE|nr:hypothetical protein [Alteromonas portus]TKB01991.1 hypothetical protein E5672_15955 [Alteromonas portus]